MKPKKILKYNVEDISQVILSLRDNLELRKKLGDNRRNAPERKHRL